MDDLILLHHDREYLEECRHRIEEKLRSQEMELNQKKTMITDIKKPILFLGFQYRLTDTGKVVILADVSKEWSRWSKKGK